MKTFKLESTPGEHIDACIKKAINVAKDKNMVVEFDFNGITILCDKDTFASCISRDYGNAHLMEWKTIGPDSPIEYDAELRVEIAQKKLDYEVKRLEQEKEFRRKDEQERDDFNELVKGVEVEFVNLDEYQKGKDKNTDPYGGAVYEYAEGWAKLMQIEISKGKKVSDIAEETSFKLGFIGISGFMYGAAVSILSNFWKYGEELREWHNTQYNHSGKGVVNPALMTVKG